MLGTSTGLLAATLALSQVPVAQLPRPIEVNCSLPGALEHALARAMKAGGAEILLHGVCVGNFTIATDGVTLRGATPDSGLAAPAGGSGFLPVVEVVDAEVALRGLTVRGGPVGLWAEGWGAELLLVGVDVFDHEAGVVASRGARARLIDSSVRDGVVGVTAQFDSVVNLQRVVVSGEESAVVAFDESDAYLSESTIENNRGAGVVATGSSTVVVGGGEFHENGEIHITAQDRSDVTLRLGVVLGSESDATPWALGANERSTITSYSTPEIHGDLYLLDGASIELGETVVHGSLDVWIFSNAYVRDAEIVEGVACSIGGEALCYDVLSPSVSGCPSPTCGAARVAATDAPPPDFPRIEGRAVDVPRGRRD
jgi:hypothetical protein